jgi:membrane protease YdiL (CAAX protease family)
LNTPAALSKDFLFLMALLAGPLCWLVLYVLYAPVPDWGTPLQYPLWFLKLALLFPVAEELLFRGLIQELVRNHVSKAAYGPLTLANLLTSVLFAAAHLFYHAPLWAALVFFPSLVFGFFKERTDALTAPVILHVFYNSGYLWLFAAPT